MGKIKKIILFFLLLLLFNTTSVKAQVTCDQCGYCEQNGVITKPISWEKCVGCLYPTISPADPNRTRTIVPGTNSPPTPYLKRQYTILGCIKSNSGITDFIQDGPASSLSEKILSTLFSIAGGIAFLYLLYGSFLLMTSQSEPGKIIQGKRVLYGAIIGLIFSLSSVLIIKLLATQILRLPGIQ